MEWECWNWNAPSAVPVLPSMGFISWPSWCHPQWWQFCHHSPSLGALWFGPQRKAVTKPRGCAQTVQELELTCPRRQCWTCGLREGWSPFQQAENRSHTNDSARNQKFVCLLSSIHSTVCIQIPIQISLKLKYWIIQCKQLCETQTSWLITLWLPLTHRNNLTPWVHVPNHTWCWVSYTTSQKQC